MANTRTHKATGATALNSTLDPGGAWQLEEARIHLNGAGGSGNLVIKIDSGDGAVYDTVLSTQDMTSLTDFVYQPTRPHELLKGDKLVFTWANSGSKTYGLTAIFHGI